MAESVHISVAASTGSAVSSDDIINKLKNFATAVYALYAASILLGVTSIVGLIVAYLKRSDAKGTWLESHFRWQIRTFWFSLLWGALGMIVSAVAGLVAGISIGAISLGGFFGSIVFIILLWSCIAIWFIYRVIKGWLNLADGKQMYFE